MSGSISNLALDENPEVLTSGIGGGGNINGVTKMEEVTKANIDRVLLENKGIQQDYYLELKNSLLHLTIDDYRKIALSVYDEINHQTSDYSFEVIALSKLGFPDISIEDLEVERIFMGGFAENLVTEFINIVTDRAKKGEEIGKIIFDFIQAEPSIFGYIASPSASLKLILQLSKQSGVNEQGISVWYHGWISQHIKSDMRNEDICNLFEHGLNIFELESIANAIQYYILIHGLIVYFSGYDGFESILKGLFYIRQKMYARYNHFALFDLYNWSLENTERDGFKCRVNIWIIQHGYGQHKFDEKYLSYTKIYGPEKGFYEFIDDFGERNMPSITNRYIHVASDMGVFLAEGHMFPTHFQSSTKGEKHDDQPYEKILDHASILYGEEFDNDFRIILQVFHSVGILKNLEDYLGIAFAQYPFSLQIHFVSFLAYATTDDMVQVKAYLSHAKTAEEKLTRLRVFLATAEGRNFGDLILNIDQKFIEKFGEIEGTKTANELFEKYVEIMDIANEDAESIKGEFYGVDSGAQFSKQKYIQELLSKANDTLEDFSKVLNSEAPHEIITEHLAACNTDMIQYGTLFRVTDKNFDTNKPLVDSLKEFGIDLLEKMGPEMNSDDKTVMMQLYETNYQSHPKKEEYLANIKRVLEGNYQNPKTKFFLLKYRGSPLLSAKFVEQDDGSVYFGAFNTAIHFQQNQLGVLVLEKLLENYSDRIIRGHVIQERKNLIRYYSRYGFEMEKDDNENSLKPDIVGGMEFCRMIRKPK